MSFPRYPKYKPSGVEWLGEVPQHWDIIQMKRIASIRYGIGEPPSYHDEGTPLIRATNVHAGKLFAEGMVFVEPNEIPEQRIVWLAAGDIIVVRSGAYTGDSAIIPDGVGPYIAGFDMGAFQRLYTYLSQIFDYGNTAIEKRSIFYKQVLRLLEFGREREGIDLSKVVLIHHKLDPRGKQPMSLGVGDNPKLEPHTEVGSGMVQEKQTAYLTEIIRKVNDLFDGDLTDQDKLVYVNNVIRGKLLESTTLKQQATNNTKEQFSNSPDLKTEILNAIISALDAHTTMSTQALGSEVVREGLKDILLGPAQLYESLRDECESR